MKRERSMDIFDDMVPDKSSTESTQKEHEKTTGHTESLHEAYEKTTAGELRPYRIRFPENHWNILKAHFEAKGMKISEGLRMIAREYIEKKSL